MSKHTPGPWTVIPPGHGSETEYLCVQIGEDDSYTTLEMRPADARLIAAAPDLLEALRAAYQALMNETSVGVRSAEKRQVELALAKARGEGER